MTPRTDPAASPMVCSTTAEVAAAIAQARGGKQKLRVHGSGHSYPSSIVCDPGPGTLGIVLDPFAPVSRPGADGTVTAWAGTHLGPDPRTAGTDETNTLLPVLFGGGSQQDDWALADTGGIIHQTVGGFLSTGSSGGTTTRPVESQIDAFEIVGADGVPFTVRRDDGDLSSGNPFFAAGVSLGLLGVVTHVTLSPRRAFYISGSESVTDEDDCAVDLFGTSGTTKPSLQEWLEGDRFTRLTWWPQKNVGRVALWSAQEMTQEIDPSTFVPRTYKELGHGFSPVGLIDAGLHWEFWNRLYTTLKANLPAIEAAYQQNQALLDEDGAELARYAIAELQADKGDDPVGVIVNLLTNQEVLQLFVCVYFTLLAYRSSGGLCETLFGEIFESEQKFEDVYSPMIMNDLFITRDVDNDPPEAQTFHDRCWHGLPMDNQIIDGLMPTVFTELWLPMSDAQRVMSLLRDYYRSTGYGATGTYACEIYGAAPSEFWISPSYGADPVVRVDLYYFAYSPDDPGTVFYPQFWKLLADNGIQFRPHWGKYLPPADGALGWSYLRTAYPRMGDFLALRQKLDPTGLFLSDYWRDHLGVGR